MSGVAEVYTVSDILSPATPEQESMRLALDPRFAGDLIVNYAPGWDVVDDEEFPSRQKIYALIACGLSGFPHRRGTRAGGDIHAGRRHRHSPDCYRSAPDTVAERLQKAGPCSWTEKSEFLYNQVNPRIYNIDVQ